MDGIFSCDNISDGRAFLVRLRLARGGLVFGHLCDFGVESVILEVKLSEKGSK